jgi:hypothetical protein
MIRSPFCSLRGREFGFEGGFAALVDFQKNNLRALIAGVETPIFHPSDEDPSLGTPAYHPSAEKSGRMGHPATCRVM